MNVFLERHSALIAWLGGLGIPLAIVIVGWLITTSSESSKLDTEYVRIALQILNSGDREAERKNLPLTSDEQALRQWAVRLLNQKSPEKFTEAEQRALLSSRRPFGQLPGNELGAGSFTWALIEAVRRGERPPEAAASGPR